jgi:hypothetical protein
MLKPGLISLRRETLLLDVHSWAAFMVPITFLADFDVGAVVIVCEVLVRCT